MSRTIRRKDYVPQWVTSELCAAPFLSGLVRIKLEGNALKKQLRWWHEDKGNDWWHISPKKSFRKRQEVGNRMVAKNQLDRFRKNAEYEVFLGKIPYPYWD